MLGFIIFAIVIVILFKILSTARKKVDAIKNAAFAASYKELEMAQNDLAQRMVHSDLDPITAKKVFDKRTRSILRKYGLNAYGDESEIPVQRYSDFKDHSRKLRKKFNKRIEV